MTSSKELTIRSAHEADLDDIEEMIENFVTGHPAESHQRSRAKLRQAYFGARPVANLLVATRGERVIGMAQWALIYDMFWSAYGGNVEWLYVRPSTAEAALSRPSSRRSVRRCGTPEANSCTAGAFTRWRPSMNASRWDGKRTNATSPPRPFKHSPISRGSHRETSFVGSPIQRSTKSPRGQGDSRLGP